jgi:hypothetical protein
MGAPYKPNAATIACTAEELKPIDDLIFELRTRGNPVFR